MRRAFTLIEVLIGVLILALGLLGLGAIIPVVVREQRAAADAGLGVTVANSAQKYLTSLEGTDPQATGPRFTIWDLWLCNSNWGWTNPGRYQNEQYLWTVKTDEGASTNTVVNGAPFWYPPTQGLGPAQALHRVAGLTNMQYTFDVSSGSMIWTADAPIRQDRASTTQPWPLVPVDTTRARASFRRISVADRLWPSPQVRTEETIAEGADPYRPQFVWDFVARRLPPDSTEEIVGVTAPGRLQVALFVRRLDLNIKLPPAPRPPDTLPAGVEYTLFGVLTQASLPAGQQTLDPSSWRVPVADDTDGLPTGAGFDPRDSSTPRKYSKIKSVEATVSNPGGARDVLKLTTKLTNRAALLRSAAQPGQKLIDNLGNIYTVRGVPDPETITRVGEVDVVVEPAVPDGVFPTPTQALPSDTQNSNVLRQVVFTSQIPAAVRVFTVSRPANAPLPASN